MRAARLALAKQPSDAVSGVSFTTQPVVEIRDSSNALVTTSSEEVTASIAVGNGVLAGTMKVNAVGGVATFTDLAIDGAGTQVMAFSAEGVDGVSSNTIVVAHPAGTVQTPAFLAIVTQPRGAVTGAPFTVQPVVRILDEDGLLIASGANATLAVTAVRTTGTGVLTGTSTVNAVAGVATFTDLQINGAGTAALTFSLSAPPVQTASNSFVVASAPPGPATQLAVVSQPVSASSGVAFVPAPIVEVRDAAGNLASSSTSVTATLTSGSGTLTGTLTVQATNGVATFGNLRVNGSGAHTITFTAAGLATATSAPIAVTQSPASLLIQTQPADAISGVPFATQPSIQIVDAAGLVVPGAALAVTATRSSGAGTLSGTTTVAAVNGVATFTNLTIVGSGAHGLTFSAPGVSSATSVSFTVASSGLPATQLVITTQPSANAQSGTPFATQPVIRLRDASNNAVAQAGVAVTAAIATGAGSLSGTITAVTNANGIATFSGLGISGNLGDRTLTFSSPGLASATSSTISVASGPATKLAISIQPSPSAQNGVALPQQPFVQLRDAGDNAVLQSGILVTASIATGGGSLVGTTTVATNSNGVAQFTNLALTGALGDRTLSFAATSLTPATSGTVSLGIGPATKLRVVVQPSGSAQSGVPLTSNPAVQLSDAGNNPVAQAGVAVAVLIQTGAGVLSGTASVATDVDGLATFTDLVVTGTVGDRTLGFSSTGLTGATSSVIAVGPGVATKLVVASQPGGAVTGNVFASAPVVQVRDASNNVVTGSTAAITAVIASGTGTLSGTTTTAAANGAATFGDLSITGTGAFTLSFSSSGLADGVSSTFTVSDVAGSATQLAVTTQPSGAFSGVAFTTQPVVQIRDANNALVPVSGTVTAAIATGTGTLSGTTAVTAANGVATFTNLAITGSGNVSLRFSSTGLTSATSATFGVTGTAAKLAISTQPSASVSNATAFPQQPVIQLRDASNNAVSQGGVTVSAVIASGGGTLGGTLTATTNPSGVATFSNLSITGTTGGRTVRFTASGLTSVTSTTVTVTAGAATQLGITTQASAFSQSGVSFAQQPVVQLRDLSGNAVGQSGITVTAALLTGTGTLGGSTTATTSISGAATFAGLNITGSGAHSLTFGATGLASVTSAVTTITGPPTQASITTQPSAVAQSGVAFAQQPSVQLRDASSNPVSQSGIVVTAAIASGGGTLGGSVTATTNANGLASFTSLMITGTDGDRTLSFTPTGIPGVTSDTVSLAQAAPSNEPAGFTKITERSFSSFNEDGWLNSSLGGASIVADNTGAKSPGNLIRLTYPAGFRAGGGPASTANEYYLDKTRIYGSIWIRWSSNFQGEDSGTNKVIFNWIHDNPAVFLSAEGTGSGVLEPTIRLQNTPDSREYLFPNMVGNAHVVRGQWHRWEYLFIANTPGSANGIARWWFDGVLIGEYKDVKFAASGQSNTWQIMQLNPTWGGTSGVVNSTMWIDLDHAYLSGAP